MKINQLLDTILKGKRGARQSGGTDEKPRDPKDQAIHEIGQLVRTSENALKHDWDQLALVFDVSPRVLANSGFLYKDNIVTPFSAKPCGDKLALNRNVRALNELVEADCGQSFKQLLLQMNRSTQQVKIWFEFDYPRRWSVTPANLRQMREELRPAF